MATIVYALDGRPEAVANQGDVDLLKDYYSKLFESVVVLQKQITELKTGLLGLAKMLDGN